MPIDVDFDWSVDTKGYRIEYHRIIAATVDQSDNID